MDTKTMEYLFDTHKMSLYGIYSDILLLKEIYKSNQYEIIMYGAGNAGVAAIKFLKDHIGILPSFIIDKNPKRKTIDTIPVISLSEFENERINISKKYCSIMALQCFTENSEECDKISTKLKGLRVKKLIDIYFVVTRSIKPDWYNYFINSRNEICENIMLFSDNISRETYYEYIRAYLEGHSYEGKVFKEEDKYFGVEEPYCIFENLKDECWINIGSFIGDTIFNFINKGLFYEKIYAVEGDIKILELLKGNLSFLSQNDLEKIEIIPSYFGNKENEKKLDEIFDDKRVTLINMDIEGAEEEVLNGARNVILKNRPVLSICVYHKMNDLISIPKVIQSIVQDYTFYLRKYPSLRGGYYDGIYETNELVLYAVPNERNIYQQ